MAVSAMVLTLFMLLCIIKNMYIIYTETYKIQNNANIFKTSWFQDKHCLSKNVHAHVKTFHFACLEFNPAYKIQLTRFVFNFVILYWKHDAL